MKLSSRMKFLINNGLKGLVWFAVLIAAYLSFEEFVISKDPERWMETFYARPIVVYLIYLASEFFIGIIPPELFMIWSIKKANTAHYFWNVAFFCNCFIYDGLCNISDRKIFAQKGFIQIFAD